MTDPTTSAAALRFAVRIGPLLRMLAAYPPDHSALQRPLTVLAELANDLLDLAGPVEVRVVDAHVRLGSQVLRPSTPMRRILQEIEPVFLDFGIGGVELLAVTDRRQLDAALRLLVEGNDHVGAAALNDALLRSNVSTLRFVDPAAVQLDEGGDGATQALRLYLRGARAVLRSQEDGLSPALVLELRDIGRGIVALAQDAPLWACLLTCRGDSLPIAVRRPLHKTLVSSVLAFQMGVARDVIEQLALAGLLSGVAEEAPVAERGLLTAQALLAQGRLDVAWRRQVLTAFERDIGFDASGMPPTLRWEPLHPFSRLLAVVGAYETALRPEAQQTVLDVEGAIEVLEAESGRRFDPVVVEHMVILARRTAALHDLA